MTGKNSRQTVFLCPNTSGDEPSGGQSSGRNSSLFPTRHLHTALCDRPSPAIAFDFLTMQSSAIRFGQTEQPCPQPRQMRLCLNPAQRQSSRCLNLRLRFFLLHKSKPADFNAGPVSWSILNPIIFQCRKPAGFGWQAHRRFPESAAGNKMTAMEPTAHQQLARLDLRSRHQCQSHPAERFRVRLAPSNRPNPAAIASS